jgi:hypothetical protein
VSAELQQGRPPDRAPTAGQTWVKPTKASEFTKASESTEADSSYASFLTGEAEAEGAEESTTPSSAVSSGPGAPDAAPGAAPVGAELLEEVDVKNSSEAAVNSSEAAVKEEYGGEQKCWQRLGASNC